jgi:hypothetical protein
VLLAPKLLFAQIKIPDASFEDVDVFTDKFFTWKVCQGTPYVFNNNSSFSSQYHPNKMIQTNGDYCAHIVGSADTSIVSDSINQIIGIQISCPLRMGKKHFFFIDLSTIIYNDNNQFVAPGSIQVLLGDSLCKYQQIAWTSPILDSVWHRYKVEFIPDDNYQYMALKGWCLIPEGVGSVWVDNLSDIYIDDKIGDVKLNVTKQQIAAGECVQLSSEVFTTYKTITWSSEPQGFSSTLQNPKEVCPTQTTKYKVQLTDSCGYNAWDTVTVYVHHECGYNLPTFIKTNESLVANYEGLSMVIYNSIGQLVYQAENYNDTWQPTTKGLYIVFVRCVNGSKRSFKLVVE